MTIEAGKQYTTRDGRMATIWEWGKNLAGVPCWVGTVKDGGWTCWDREGRDLDGQHAWDLIQQHSTCKTGMHGVQKDSE